ncbi:uncharacterized protein LOC124253410 [Haliotis rubra]|uniref:uncharacterized protein LOC124253410 n=1 Tax=Haliotis rubra TaxID=36100 RepID=UPI001EE5BCC5|nr:uncharacterized protein LOC124253410 [Haliotis rubra]
MGSTSSIAKPEAAEVDPDMFRSSSNRQPSTALATASTPPPPPPPPPVQSSSGDKDKKSHLQDGGADEVDAPLYDPKSKRDVFGTLVADPKVVQEKTPEGGEMSEASVKVLKSMKEKHPQLADTFHKQYQFVSVLKGDLLLETERNYLQNSAETDVTMMFLNETDINRSHMADFFAEINAASVFYDSYRALMTKEKLEYMTDSILEGRITKPEIMFLVNLRGIMWNYSDASSLFAEKLGSTGVFEDLVKDLQHMKEGDLGLSFESCVGILHNTSKILANRPLLRAQKTGQHLLPFLKCQKTAVKMLTLLTLSYVLDESQNDLLLADDSVFDFILIMIKQAWKTKEHRYNGFSVLELVDGVTGLAKNDDNKKLIAKKGAVETMMKIMKDGSDDEKLGAVKCIWELSFDNDNRKSFHENDELMTLLKSLKMSDNRKLSKAAGGALWEIHLYSVDRAVNGKAGAQDGGQGGGHIMISYQWADQKKLLQVKEILRGQGYSVWMDVDNMGGSTLQAMAEAVQNAAVLLVCMSERYKESQNCRSEAEYAFSLQKTIVPLLMQRAYKPDGWLGMIKGTKLFFDLSGKYEFEGKVNELIKELGDKGKTSSHGIVDETKIPVIRAGPVDAGKGASVTDWSSKDVLNWLHKSKVTMNENLKKLTGEQVAFLRKLSHRAPEYYFSYIERKLHLESLDDMMHFSNGLDNL